MKRKVLMALLAMGTVFGFASGFASVRCHTHARRAAFERHVADLCVEAAEGRQRGASRAPTGM